uniref:VWFA domain-containing protein n=1 Tax=Mola mola TaxID=94237 RepID=A0A3Q3W1H8_MOLML
ATCFAFLVILCDSTKLNMMLKEYYFTLPMVYFLSSSGCRTAPCDLVFILDGSWSVEDVSFEIVKRWLVNMTTSFKIGQKFTQVGVVQYSDNPVLEIPLGKYSTNKDLITAMENIEYMGGNTRTGAAIKFSTDKLFGLSERGPAGISRIAVVLTDGKSQDEVLKAAEAARKKGVILFAIGVGSETEEAELKDIANQPFSTYVFSVKDYKAISKIIQVIRQKLCEGKQLLLSVHEASCYSFSICPQISYLFPGFVCCRDRLSSKNPYRFPRRERF